MSEQEAREYPIKIKIQQSAKGFSYWEVVVKADDLEGAKVLLDNSIDLAKTKCEDLNKVLV